MAPRPQSSPHANIWYALGSDTCNCKIFYISQTIQIFIFPDGGRGEGFCYLQW